MSRRLPRWLLPVAGLEALIGVVVAAGTALLPVRAGGWPRPDLHGRVWPAV